MMCGFLEPGHWRSNCAAGSLSTQYLILAKKGEKSVISHGAGILTRMDLQLWFINPRRLGSLVPHARHRAAAAHGATISSEYSLVGPLYN